MINHYSFRGQHWLAVSFILLAYALAHAETNVSGTVAPGSLQVIAPASYVPGVPFLVRVDLKDAGGALNRNVWNATATLAGSNGVTFTPNSVTLVNGMGSALVSVGGSTAGPPVIYLTYGTGGTGGAVGSVTGTPGSMWRHRTDLTSATVASIPTTWKDPGFDDSAWPEGPGQIGYGDAGGNGDPPDENFRLAVTDYGTAAGVQVAPAYLFRRTFTIADISQISSLTGQVRYDDAAVVYVNGTEVLRTVGFDTPANVPQVPLTVYSNFGGAVTTENATADFTVPMNLVHNGVNTIAVQIHQHDNGSSDMSFDCRLQGNTSSTSTDPGNFTLTATSGPLGSSKALTSLGAAPGTTVSGTLPAGITNWSGVVRVTGDVTVPAGATLNIAAGTHVLMTGTGAGSTSGTDIIVNGSGTINANGTAAQPVSITSSDAATRWGEINTGGAATTWTYCLISHAGHATHGGHTDTGPCVRLANGAVFNFSDGVISDLPGKTLTNGGSTTITMRRSQFARCVMGPEVDASGITIEDCNFTDMLPTFREGGGADDEDNIYIDDSDGRPVNLRRSVFANSADDGIDCLAGSLTVEDCIVRNILDKGISLLQNDITVRRTQIVDCDFCISTKTQLNDEDTTYTTTLENCTLVGEAHPTNQSDQSGGVYWHNVGVHVRNKYGTGPDAQLRVVAKNCIISAVTPMLNDYAVAGNNHPLTTVSYTCYQDVAGPNPVDPAPPSGTGTIVADPLFVNAAGKDFHPATGSPAINAGDPAPAMNDPDGSRNDMGALPFTANSGSSTVTWNVAGSPYHMTANTTVPAGVTLIIEPGVSVYGDQNVRLTVNGRITAAGTTANHITFSGVPGAVATGDADPLKNGNQTGPPKWGGVRVVDSMTQENVFSYCDFINAQGTAPSAPENFGSVGFIRSWGWADHLTFSGTHLRMCYGRNSIMTVTHCNFPDMFIQDAALGRIENPTDFVGAADNNMEPLKVEYPTTDPELAGQTGAGGTFPNGLPRDGHWRVYYNDFHGNRGHQDVFDADSGRWGQSGQFVLDCRHNTFHGLTGDEHIDLGGDAFIAENRFYSGSKDQWTIDTGYANAISSGDKGSGTTIVVAGNVFYDLDHAINCKINTATIFEHNTCVDFHQDWAFDHTVTQNVQCAAVNLFVPNDGNAAGDGCYIAFNVFFGNAVAPDDTVNPDPVGGFPRLVSWPDVTTTGPKTSIIRIENNFVDNRILDTSLGANHPGGIFAPAWGFGNLQGDPMFTDKAAKDFSLKPGSPAKGTAQGGLDFGATVGQWAYVIGGPTGTVTSTTASFTVGGPGIVAYKWRLDGGAWSASIQIGDGGVMPRTGPIVRQATLTLNNLTAGAHTLEVLGQDMAANWQDNDPARTVEGLTQAAATTRTWTVDTGTPTGLNAWLTSHGLTTADLGLDGDGDGLTNLVEYSLGTDPASGTGGQGAAVLPVPQLSTIGGNAVPAMRAAIPVSSQPGGFGLPDVSYIFQDSTDTSAWRDLLRKNPTDAGWQNVSGSPLVLVESLGNAGGSAQFVLKSPDSISSTPRHYLRLKIVQIP